MSEKQEQQNTERSRMLGTMEMRKLVPTVSVPIMVSMLVQNLQYQVLHLHMEAGYQYLQLLQCAVSHSQQLLAGDFTVRDVLNSFLGLNQQNYS